MKIHIIGGIKHYTDTDGVTTAHNFKSPEDVREALTTHAFASEPSLESRGNKSFQFRSVVRDDEGTLKLEKR